MKRKNMLSSICENNGIALAYLFGSQAHLGRLYFEGGTVTLDDPLTDLDLGIVFSDPLPPSGERPELYAKLYNLLSELFLPLPLDLLVFLQELGQAQIVTPQLSEKMVKMAGYRNRLVHLYHMVADDELYEIVQNNVPDLVEFVREINLYINENA